MKRRLFNLAAAMSLILCVAVCLLWVRSYWVEDGIGYRASERGGPQLHRGISSNSGEVALVSLHFFMSRWPNGLYHYHRTINNVKPPGDTFARRLGFGMNEFGRDYPGFSMPWGQALWFPHWVLVLVAGMPAALWLLANRRAARRQKLRGFAVEQVSTAAS